LKKVTPDNTVYLVPQKKLTNNFMLPKRINSFLITTIIDIALFIWSFHNISNKLGGFRSPYFIFFIGSFIFVLVLFSLLDRGIGTKLKHKRRDISAFESIAYVFSLCIGLVTFSFGKKIFIYFSTDLTYTVVYFGLNLTLLVFILRIMLLKIKVWFKWSQLEL